MRSAIRKVAVYTFSLTLGLSLFDLDSVWSFSPNTPLSEANLTVKGESNGDWAGWSVAALGDVNGDEVDDFAIGAKENDYNGNTAGQVYVVFGRKEGFPSTLNLAFADASFVGEDMVDRAGFDVAGVGDVNHDGLNDILIGAPDDDDGGTNAGQCYLILGKEQGWAMRTNLADSDASFVGESSGNVAGFAVSGVGDVNGDFYDDFIIGAPWNEGRGQVYLILGKENGWEMRTPLADSDASFQGETGGSDAGWYVSGGGDYNGDGLCDILIGAPKWGGALGQAYVIFGKETGWAMRTSLSESDASYIGVESGEEVGWSLSDVGNVNGDEYDDILLGAPGDQDIGSTADNSYLIYGREDGWQRGISATQATAMFVGEESDDESGWNVSGAGDVNRDGYADFLIGAFRSSANGFRSGKAYLYLGHSGDYEGSFDLSVPHASYIAEFPGDEAGWSVSALGDINGDDFQDFGVGAKQRENGKGYVYVIYGNDSPFVPFVKNQNLSTGDILTSVFDGLNSNRGGLYLWNHETGTSEIFSQSDLYFDPQGLAIGDSGICYLADDDAKPNNQGPGAAVFAVNLSTEKVDVVSTDDKLASPSAIVIKEDGNLYLVDWDANPNGFGHNTGAVFEIDVSTGSAETFAANDRFGLPFDLAVSAGGQMALVDRDPFLGDAIGGGVFLLDPNTGAVLVTFNSSDWIGPEGVFFIDENTLLVSDSFGNQIHKLDLTTGNSTVLSDSPFLSAPRRMIWSPDGDVLVSGRRVVKINPTTGETVPVLGIPQGEHVGIGLIPDIPPFNGGGHSGTPIPSPTPTETPTPTNAPPTAPVVQISPEEPMTFDDLICQATGSVDPEGGSVSYGFQWFRDGIAQNETEFGEETTSVIEHSETSRDEVWRCLVTARDDAGETSTGEDEVTIQNTPPTQPVIKTLPENPLPGDGMAVLITTQSTDADGDSIVYLFEWFRLTPEGEWDRRPEVSGSLSPFAPGEPEISGLYTAGETWKVEVTPLESRSLSKRLGSKGVGVIAGLPGVDRWIVLPDFAGDGKVDVHDILRFVEMWHEEQRLENKSDHLQKGGSPFEGPPRVRDLILVSPLGWQGKP